jgi:predicted nucleic acid-binding protein
MANEVDFYVAEANAAEAAGTIGELATRRGLDPQVCQEAFLSLMEVVQIVDTTWIETARDEALTRIRDPADWPALALALQLECAIWTAVVRNDQSAAHERVLLPEPSVPGLKQVPQWSAARRSARWYRQAD